MSEWQDISTAPKDGRDVQLWDAEGWIPRGHYSPDKQGWYVEYWDADLRFYDDSRVYDVTHWMPLPTPPHRQPNQPI